MQQHQTWAAAEPVEADAAAVAGDDVSGLVAARETERDQMYPERTVHEITDAGCAVARAGLEEMLAVPKREFPQFPAAMSHLLMLSPSQISDALERRRHALTAMLAGLDAGLTVEATRELPRIATLESERLRAVTAAEANWVGSVIDDLRSSRVSWSPEQLIALSKAGESALDG